VEFNARCVALCPVRLELESGKVSVREIDGSSDRRVS